MLASVAHMPLVQTQHLYAKAAVESYGAQGLDDRYQAALRAVAAVETELAGTTEGTRAQLQSLLRISEDRLGGSFVLDMC
jgi:hypothetical protein